ncbi:hypothetical protein R3P38DRAFT_2638826 [Favolaschia claudopus]|uniref:CCHC-type domain-containing protein n=1 Tax=Favolaschia claudopus TaxID=2862362 RepID=A0AAW0ALL9_9AGAR
MSDNGISGLSSSFLKNSGQTPIPRTLKPGDVVLSAEAIQALKKMDILRLERNNKRDERRKAGEKDVSEDEGEGLAPLITLVPSGEIPTDFGALDAQESEAPKLLFDDSKAALNSFQAIDDSIPSAIFFLAKNGISPPLTIFLPASLARIRSSNIKTVKHGTGESTKITVIDISDFPTEDGLDQATWCTTYNTFLTFMELAAGPKIFQGFASHYNYILSDPEFAQWFTAYRDFDQRLRARFFTQAFIIDCKTDEYRAVLQSAKNSFLMSSHSSPSASSSRTTSSTAKGDRADRSKPYDRDSSRKKPMLCFRCGRTGHSAHTCEQAEPSRHGRQFVIFANREGLFRISDKRAVCMGYNCGRCDSNSRSHPIHICSLCADSHHGAADCTRN